MPVTPLPSTSKRRRSRREPSHRRLERPSPAAARRRRIDAPQDIALYTCHCGFAWHGAVIASVGCPSCGAAQAW